MDRSLLVPIKLRAVVCGAADKNTVYSAMSYRFEDMGDANADIDCGLFLDSPGLEPGVHLHWSLPEGLAFGRQADENSPIEYPPIPNRWLIARIWQTSEQEPPRIKTFLLESDALQARCGAKYYNENSPSYPHLDTPDMPYRYLGRCLLENAEIPPCAERVARLTAVSPVSPFFAAYYPLCRNVLGFWDNLAGEGLENIRLSYLVTGWYDSLGDEPLRSITTLGQLNEYLLMSVDETAFKEPLKRMVCHGLVGGVEWKTAGTRYPTGLPDDPEPGQVVSYPHFGLGNNTSEALAALGGVGDHDGSDEWVLHCLLEDMLPALLGSQTLGESERELHRREFAVIQPTDIYRIRRTERGNTPDSDSAPDSGNAPNRKTLAALAGLRQRQRKLFGLRAKLLQVQRSAYESFFLYRCAPDAKWRGEYLKRMRTGILAARNGKTEIEREERRIADELSKLDIGGGYTPDTEPDERFYLPNEPVLVMLQRMNIEARVSESLTPCRVSAQTVSGLSVDKVSGKTVALSGAKLHAATTPVVVPPFDFNALVDEAVLFSRGFTRYLARAAFAAAGVAKPADTDVAALAARIAAAQEQPNVQPGIVFAERVPDARAVSAYTPEWYPLLIEWESGYYPDTRLSAAKPSLDGWAYSGGAYAYGGTPGSIITPKNRMSLTNRMLISDNAERRLTAMTLKHLPALRENADAPREERYISQMISGFHDMLLTRDQLGIMPVFDGDARERMIIDELRELEPEAFTGIPLFDGRFYPIRAGFMEFGRIRIIDMLGRVQEPESLDVALCDSMRLPGQPVYAARAMLQPRLMQASRVRAEWLSAERMDGEYFESSPFPEASPVCGYVVLNRLDNSLMAYTADGDYAGSLNLTETGGGIAWKSPPGSPPSHEIPPGLNEQLYRFLCGLRDAGHQALSGFAAYLDRLMYYILPGSPASGAAEYFGRPLALARAEVILEQLGGHEEYRHNEAGGARPDPTASTDVSNAVFPITLGVQADTADGMVGFFRDDDYSEFSVYGNVFEFTSAYFRTQNAAELKMDTASRFTFLLEPKASVFLLSGILPSVRLTLPEELIAENLLKMHAFYFTAPLIGEWTRPRIPVPRRDDSEYTFFRLAPEGGWEAFAPEAGERQNAWPQTAMEGHIQIRKKE